MGLLDKVKTNEKNNSVKDAALGLLGKTDTETAGQGTGVIGQLKNIVQADSSAKNQAPTWNYTKSDAVLNAEAQLQDHLSGKPGEYQPTWQDQLNDTLQQILNRDKFSYDLNGDMLYQQYKDQYITQGKLASMDVMGQAAAMTGGYGNSYAQTAGQQAYQGYLQQLNDVVPELYGMALDQYNQEGQNLYNQAGLLAQMDEQEYGRYMDKLSQYYTDLNYLTENARYMSETEYNQALQDFNIKYGSYRDDVSDQQWQTSFDEGIRQYNEQFAYKKEQDNLANNMAQKQLNASLKKDGGTVVNDDPDETGKTGVDATVIEGIRKKLDGLKSNTAVEQYLENLEATGSIDHETALQLMAEYMDSNEVYKEKEDGSKSISYSDMVQRTSGWSVIDNGGTNWFWGVDNNAIVEAPNGEQIRLDNLVDKLVGEGMNKSDAKNLVKKLQKNLDIA